LATKLKKSSLGPWKLTDPVLAMFAVPWMLPLAVSMLNTGCIVPFVFVNTAILKSPKKWAFALLLFMNLAKNHALG